MKYSSKFILPMLLVAFSALGRQSVDPTSMTLTYGDSSVSAEIRKDRKFDITRSNDDENVEFSGSVTKEDTDYIVDVLVLLENKSNNSSREINTTILVRNDQLETLIFIGGVNNERFSITLK
ncbi:putative exported protein [Vibrio coralliirubri]|uniref:hypothetical protein n=1 Tax=Vibrio TaxID=662 RepID=UPI0006346162|nr:MULTISPECIES: hypothetical protein [Vibrio]CDT53229.1 putative exported protein [Vibrio coralliirubri]